MEAILDTSFIISCIMKKIDFLSQLEESGFKVIVPREVVRELKGLRLSSKASHEERAAIDIALEMVYSKRVKSITLGERKVDEVLIEKGKQGVYIATLDAEIKRNVPNKIVIFNAKKEIGIERD